MIAKSLLLDEEITLRDYMAIHSTQPGCSEVVAMAGLVFSLNQVWDSPEHSLGTFNVWYESLTIDKKLDLCSRVRYAQADSMLHIRGESL